MTELYGEQWLLAFLISAVITWTWGLTPPLLIRFVLVRGSISKVWAIGIVSVLWVLNFTVSATLNAALDGGTRVHSVWFLVAVASYYILRKGAKDKRTESPSRQSPKDSGAVGYSEAGDNSVKVAQLEVRAGKQKPEILAQARQRCDNDGARIDEEYVNLRTEELKRQAASQPAAHTRSVTASSGNTPGRAMTVQPAKKPPDWVVYIVFAAVVIPFAAIYGSEHIKAFIAGFTAPANKEDCVNKFVYPASTETAARALMISCTRQFDSNKPLSEWDRCLRDGELSSITTETAAKARVRNCNRL